MEVTEKYETLVKEYRDTITKTTELEKEFELLKHNGRKLKEQEGKTDKYLNTIQARTQSW